MVNQSYKVKDLPLKEMESLGLATKGKVNLSGENLNALLSGNRTDLVRINNISSNGIEISKLDAKLSLRPTEDGKLNLLLHPIYKNAQAPAFLSKVEVEELTSGEENNIIRIIGEGKNKKTVFVEYDKETNEFLQVDSAKVIAPESVNDQTLTPAQKKRFQQGLVIDLQDDTSIQATGKNNKGIVSNRTMLVLSVLLDGGLSYMLIKAIQAIEGKKKQLDYNAGYNAALDKVLKEQKQRNIPPVDGTKNLVILKDYMEVLPLIEIKDKVQVLPGKIDVNNLKLEPKHLDVLKEVVSYENLHELPAKVNPILNRELANNLSGAGHLTGDPVKDEHFKLQAKQLEHFATLAEVVAMIETKRDKILNYIQESSQSEGDQDYLKDVVACIGSSISPGVVNKVEEFINESVEKVEELEEEKAVEKLHVNSDTELQPHAGTRFKR